MKFINLVNSQIQNNPEKLFKYLNGIKYQPLTD